MVQWIPGRIVSESVDPFHMTSVDCLQEWGRGPVERIFRRFDGGVLHIHGNGRHLLPAVAEFEGLKAIFLGDDRGFPKRSTCSEKSSGAWDRRRWFSTSISPVSPTRLIGTRLAGGVLYRVRGVPGADAANG